MRKVILELCAGALLLLELITYPLYSGISGRGIGKEYNTLWAIIGFILVIQALTLIIAKKKDKDEFRYGVTLILTLQVLYIIILLTLENKERKKREIVEMIVLYPIKLKFLVFY